MRIKVQKAPQQPLNTEDILARFCYYFPRYSYLEAKKLPFKRVRQMLRVVEKEQAKKNFELIQIVASPHTKNGRGVEKLLEYYKGIIED